MTLDAFMNLAGWYATAVAICVAVILWVTRHKEGKADREGREQLFKVLIVFGWIPAGALILLLQALLTAI